jgi:hypothetical protein
MITSSEVFAQHWELRLTARAQAASSVPAGENITPAEAKPWCSGLRTEIVASVAVLVISTGQSLLNVQPWERPRRGEGAADGERQVSLLAVAVAAPR